MFGARSDAAFCGISHQNFCLPKPVRSCLAGYMLVMVTAVLLLFTYYEVATLNVYEMEYFCSKRIARVATSAKRQTCENYKKCRLESVAILKTVTTPL